MTTLNLILWSVGVALQAALLILLFRRRLARRMPVFTFIIAFYIVRACLLYGLFSNMERVAYTHLFNALSVVDLFLQILLALEIALHTLREAHSIQPGQSLRVTAMLAAGAVLAALVALAFPIQGRVPLDRGVIFTTLLLLLLLAWMMFARVHGLPRRVAEGFALYGVVAVLAGIARNLAALHRSQTAFIAASYAQTGIYVCIVAFWILTLRPAQTQLTPKG